MARLYFPLYYHEVGTDSYLRVETPPLSSSRLCGLNVAIYRAFAPTIAGDPESLEWTHVSAEYLDKSCAQVKGFTLPSRWKVRLAYAK